MEDRRVSLQTIGMTAQSDMIAVSVMAFMRLSSPAVISVINVQPETWRRSDARRARQVL